MRFERLDKKNLAVKNLEGSERHSCNWFQITSKNHTEQEKESRSRGHQIRQEQGQSKLVIRTETKSVCFTYLSSFPPFLLLQLNHDNTSPAIPQKIIVDKTPLLIAGRNEK